MRSDADKIAEVVSILRYACECSGIDHQDEERHVHNGIDRAVMLARALSRNGALRGRYRILWTDK